ncbi:hypothetical protein Agub_g7328 [Astrephomene gubernaculifera]|uniref:Uncharacterized protein n=1 Tax=Astrephomene gubernaculifera TaxID=47775 RepID=A0AAD3HMC6_9CHLO|nr:hypothetical protein Agub_g7328 [Astrephomene gubernaculifera]
MAFAADGTFDCSSPWYAAPARPPLPASAAKRSYPWYVKEADLAAGLASKTQGLDLDGYFSNGSSRVAAFGMEWCAFLQRKKGSQAAGLFLYCTLPASLKASGRVVSAVCPGPARLAAYTWREHGSREEAWSMEYPGRYVQVGAGWGVAEALELAAPPAEGQEPSSAAAGGSGSLLAPWSAYLKDGKLQGVLEWV